MQLHLHGPYPPLTCQEMLAKGYDEASNLTLGATPDTRTPLPSACVPFESWNTSGLSATVSSS